MLDDFAMPREGPRLAGLEAVRGKRLLIALSGGADSVALLSLLHGAAKAWELGLFAAHVDHGIRPESAGDAEFCRELCLGLGIPFHCVRVDAPAEAAKRRAGLETAARELRYDLLEQFRAQVDADCIALAHHMDDQAETVLMHLARGAGIDGVCGMRTLSGRLYRPLLGWRKADLEAYLRQNGLEWREDRTNRIDDNPRNAIRLHVIPELEKCYPQFVRAAHRFALSARIEGDFLEEMTREYLRRAGSAGPFCACLELDPMPHPAVLRRAIRALCPEELTWDGVNALQALCEARRGKLDLGTDCFAERAGRRLYFVPKRLPSIEPVPLALNGLTHLAGIGRITAAPCAPVPIRDDPLRQALDPAALTGAVLRTRRGGDKFRPLGCGDRLLSDYLIDKKVDRPLRDAIPLVAVGDRVYWVCGFGISTEAALTPGCSAVELRCEPEYKELYGGWTNAQ